MGVVSRNVNGLENPNFTCYRGKLKQELMRCLPRGRLIFSRFESIICQATAFRFMDSYYTDIVKLFGQQLLDPRVDKEVFVLLWRTLGKPPLSIEGLLYLAMPIVDHSVERRCI